MTNEQAKNIIESCDGIMWNRLTDAENEALSMAIEALSAQEERKYIAEVSFTGKQLQDAIESVIGQDITLLKATKTVLEFVQSCSGTTARLMTPDGDMLSCDWGYVEEGLIEIMRYAERRTDE